MTNNVPKKYKKYLTIGTNGSPIPTMSRQTKWFKKQQVNIFDFYSIIYVVFITNILIVI